MMLAGVLLMLLSVPGYLEHNSAAERDIKTAVNFVVAGQTYDGNFPASVGEVSQHVNNVTTYICNLHSQYLFRGRSRGSTVTS